MCYCQINKYGICISRQYIYFLWQRIIFLCPCASLCLCLVIHIHTSFSSYSLSSTLTSDSDYNTASKNTTHLTLLY